MAVTPTELKALCRTYTEAAIRALVGVMTSPTAPQAAVISAANSLLDRGWGKAAQPMTGENGEGPAIIQIVRFTETTDSKPMASQTLPDESLGSSGVGQEALH